MINELSTIFLLTFQEIIIFKRLGTLRSAFLYLGFLIKINCSMIKIKKFMQSFEKIL
jgi:hypothetical protein